ncbi:hypothetical protein EKD04_005440 [Chloroflexales bacterium ZM16-3]|nr:hypothetical protein [Chloroflexales bacterium ZM16-3]
MWTTVGSLSSIVRGVTYNKSVVRDAPDERLIPVLRATNIQDAELILISDLVYVPVSFVSQEQRLQQGDVVICTSSGSKSLVGKTGQLNRDWYGSFGAFCAVARFTSEIDPRYGGYFFEAPLYREVIRDKAAGVNINNLRHGDIEEIAFPLPPLAEQRRIVAAIETQLTRLDAGVASLKAAQAKLRRYRTAVLKAACEGRLVAQDANDEPAEALLRRILGDRGQGTGNRGRRSAGIASIEGGHKEGGHKEGGHKARPDAAQPSESQRVGAPLVGALNANNDLPALPQGWVWASIDQLSIVVRGASPRPAGDPKYFGGTIPWITVGSLTADSGTPYLTSVKDFVTEAGKEASRYIEPDTLLLTNSGATLGVPKITLIGGCINDGSVALLHVDYPLKLYLYYFLASITADLRNINQGAAQPNLNTGIVKAIVIPLPPLAEQRRIVAEVERRLSVVSTLEATVAANLRRAERLRQSILKRAFAGKLVPQDPGDEPASALLERVRGDRGQGTGDRGKGTGGGRRGRTKKAAGDG